MSMRFSKPHLLKLVEDFPLLSPGQPDHFDFVVSKESVAVVWLAKQCGPIVLFLHHPRPVTNRDCNPARLLACS